MSEKTYTVTRAQLERLESLAMRAARKDAECAQTGSANDRRAYARACTALDTFRAELLGEDNRIRCPRCGMRTWMRDRATFMADHDTLDGVPCKGAE